MMPWRVCNRNKKQKLKVTSLFRRWWVWVILGLLFILLLAGIVGARYLNPWLQKELETRVARESGGRYTLRVHGLDISLLLGQVEVDSLQLIPDFDTWKQQAEADSLADLPRMLLDLRTKEVLLSGINFAGLLQGKVLNLSKLRVQQPALRLTQMRQDTTARHEPLHEGLSGIMRGLKIKTIEIKDGSLQLRESQEAAINQLEVAGLHVQVKGMKLDSAAFLDQARAYYAQGIAVETGKAHFVLADGSYRLQGAALKANTADGTLNIGNLELEPLLKHAELSRRKGSAATTVRLQLPELNASGVGYKLHSRYNNLSARLIVLQNPSLSAYMDRKNFVQKGEKPLPHDFVQQLKTGIAIEKIDVKGMHIRYEELAPDATQTGLITFEKLFATITNLSNDKNRMSANSPAVLEARTTINGNAPLAVTVRYNLLDPNGYHTIQGTAGPANPATLNQMLEPTAFMSIKEGSLQKSDFKMELTRHKATGNLNARYQNFKVDILSKDEDKRQSFGKKILSRVANIIVINTDNPKKGEDLRPGSIDVVRARNRSFFNYWKDGLVSGFRTAAGIEGVGADLQDPTR